MRTSGALGSSASMQMACTFKSCRFIAAVVGPQSEDDPDPDVGKRSHGHCVAFAFSSLARVLVSSPRFTLRGLPGKLVQSIPQRFDTRHPTMRFGVRPALKQDGRGATQRLQTAGISIAAPVITDFCQQSRSQTLACARQALKDLMVRMGQKKGLNLLVILSNLFNQRAQLTHQNQHQARFGAGRHRIGLQMGLMHALHDLLGNATGVRMSRLTQDLPDLLCRSVHRLLWSGVGLQEQQGALLLQFRKHIQGHWVVGYASGRELIDQARLHLDQRSLIACEQLE
jgi:hypothetical protein